MDATANFCTECGAKQVAEEWGGKITAESTEEVRSERKGTDRRRFLKYGAAAVVATVAAAAGYYALQPRPGPPAPATTAATVVPVTTTAPRVTTVAPITTAPATTTSASLLTSITSAAEVRMGLTSQAFKNGEHIPSRYTCNGENISPPIGWTGAPKETKSYTLIMDDLDAPGGVFNHWVIFDIPTIESGLQEHVPAVGRLSNGAVQGRNDFGEIGYGGPCPPSGTHHYVFHLYALDMLLNLQPGATKQNVLTAMRGHILAEAQLTGLYR